MCGKCQKLIVVEITLNMEAGSVRLVCAPVAGLFGFIIHSFYSSITTLWIDAGNSFMLHTHTQSYMSSLCSHALRIHSGVRMGVPMHTANLKKKKEEESS